MAVLSRTSGGRKVRFPACRRLPFTIKENNMRTAILFVLALSAFPALAETAKDAPMRKHGLWEMTIEHQGGHKMSMKTCVGPGFDSVSQQQGGPGGPGMRRQQSNCSKQTVSRQAGKVIIDSVCKHGDSTATTHAEFTGDFSTQYRADMHTRFDPPMRGMREARQVMAMRWLGPCKPGQRPGDVEMQLPGMEGRGGAPGSFNMKDMMERMKR
jgi:hypothetical protein